MKKLLLAFAAMFAINASAQDKNVTAAELPREAQTFLKQHFKGTNVERAWIDQDGTRKTFEVRLSDGTEVEFDSDGNWKEVDAKNKAVASEFVGKDIQSYVATNYPKEKMTKVSKDRRGFEVELTNGVELDFDVNGKFIKIDR